MSFLPRSLFAGLVAAVVLSACDSTPSGTLTQCSPEDATNVLPMGAPQEGNLGTDDCLIDQFRAVGWRLPVEDRARVQIDLSSGSFNPLLLVTDSALILVGIDDDSGEGSSSRLLRELGAGDYYVWALSIFRGQTGGYQISAQEMEGALCSEIVGELDPGETVSGTLSTASCIRGEDGSFADPWELTVSPGRTVEIEMIGDGFEAFVFLEDEDGNFTQGDRDGQTSRLEVELDGTYTVWANTWQIGAVGDYELSVREFEGVAGTEAVSGR